MKSKSSDVSGVTSSKPTSSKLDVMPNLLVTKTSRNFSGPEYKVNQIQSDIGINKDNYIVLVEVDA